MREKEEESAREGEIADKDTVTSAEEELKCQEKFSVIRRRLCGGEV